MHVNNELSEFSLHVNKMQDFHLSVVNQLQVNIIDEEFYPVLATLEPYSVFTSELIAEPIQASFCCSQLNSVAFFKKPSFLAK